MGAPGDYSPSFGLVEYGYGEVWILLLNSDGTVKENRRIRLAAVAPGHAFPSIPPLNYTFFFGYSLAPLGDLDGDGVGDLAVGAPYDDDGGCGGWECGYLGAVWIVFLNPDGTARRTQKISATEGGFAGILHDLDEFGSSVAPLGDLDGDGSPDLAVGAIGDDYRNDGYTDTGALWVLFLNPDGTVKDHQKIDEVAGGFTGILDHGDGFAWSLASIGDLDGDGRRELAVGSLGDDDGGSGRGAVWILSLRPDGRVKSHRKIGSAQGGFAGPLSDCDYFGSAAAWLGDLDGDGFGELAVGAMGDDDGAGPRGCDAPGDRGAVWILSLSSSRKILMR